MAKTQKPDYVFNDYPINEYWWDFLKEIDGINPGDKITVKTETNQWKNPVKIIDENFEDEITFQTKQGKKYMIVDYSSNASLEPSKPMVRTCKEFKSMGIIEEVKVYK